MDPDSCNDAQHSSTDVLLFFVVVQLPKRQAEQIKTQQKSQRSEHKREKRMERDYAGSC